jgi:hypothetical protein
MSDPLLQARALVLHDLSACGADTARYVDVVEDVVCERRWWVKEWPEGAVYVAGQVAQDVQERLLDEGLRWPPCPVHGSSETGHNLHIEPDLGPESWWACTVDGVPVAPLGALLLPETSDPQF